jgi:hypothetical protein
VELRPLSNGVKRKKSKGNRRDYSDHAISPLTVRSGIEHQAGIETPSKALPVKTIFQVVDHKLLFARQVMIILNNLTQL